MSSRANILKRTKGPKGQFTEHPNSLAAGPRNREAIREGRRRLGEDATSMEFWYREQVRG